MKFINQSVKICLQNFRKWQTDYRKDLPDPRGAHPGLGIPLCGSCPGGGYPGADHFPVR